MTFEELEKACDEAEEFAKELGIEAGINLMIPGNRNGRTCRVLPGVTAENLGHYGSSTMVFVKCSKLRDFFKTVKR